jgi:hypothetical protein
MTITLYWWTLPTVITVAYIVWALIPRYQSSMWGDLEAMFGHIIGLLAVSVSWAIAGVFFK